MKATATNQRADSPAPKVTEFYWVTTKRIPEEICIQKNEPIRKTIAPPLKVTEFYWVTKRTTPKEICIQKMNQSEIAPPLRLPSFTGLR